MTNLTKRPARLTEGKDKYCPVHMRHQERRQTRPSSTIDMCYFGVGILKTRFTWFFLSGLNWYHTVILVLEKKSLRLYSVFLNFSLLRYISFTIDHIYLPSFLISSVIFFWSKLFFSFVNSKCLLFIPTPLSLSLSLSLFLSTFFLRNILPP